MNITHSCPAVLIAAPASGQGKTTLTAALARLHARQGKRVRVFKCGPDYLDPWWHSLASGAAVQSLDLWMTGERDSRQRLAEAAKEADLILIEGVMGLFDGEPSAADLAEKFGLPIVLLMDGSSMAGTFGALAWGLQHFRPNLHFAGVLANRIGSDGHAKMLRDSLRPGLTWLGHLPRDAGFSLPERHLGLVAAHELPDALERLDRLADALEKTPLGQMDDSALQAWSVSFSLPKCSEIPPLLAGKKIAIARDEAFCFIYPANIETLEKLGADIRFFSPLHDETLPECDALWLPGGYPELHAQRLSEHRSMHLSIRQHVDAGKPIWAECGGMMALFSELHDLEGSCVPMWGIFPGATRMQKRLAGLGAQAIEAAALWAIDAGLFPDLRGHTFHYSVAETPLQPAAYASNNTRKGEAIYVQGAVRGSYVHAYFPSSPSIVAALFGAAL